MGLQSCEAFEFLPDSHPCFRFVSSQKSLLMHAGGNTNMSQQAPPLAGMSYEQLLNLVSAVANSQQQQSRPPTQTAALAQHLQVTSDQRRNFM